MRVSSYSLVSRIRWPRTIAWLLVALLLVSAWLQTDNEIFPGLAGIGFLLSWPVSGGSGSPVRPDHVRLLLLVDSTFAGLLIGLFSSAPVVVVCLAIMLLVSLLIVGSVQLLARAMPPFALGWGIGCLFPITQAMQLDFLVLSLLLTYMGLVSFLVYRETVRLAKERLSAQDEGARLELQKRRLVPYVAQQIVGFDRSVIERKRLTILFSDIEGFTGAMDNGDEAVVAAWLNSYFGAMTEIAEQHGGTLDKFLGDGLMVFFGDPESAGSVADAYACVAMALAMRERLLTMVNELDPYRPHVRIGIHSGDCLVGSFGSDKRKDYTALGNSVNLASRIESVADSDEILVSEATFRLLWPWVNMSYRGQRQLKGISTAIAVYSVESLVGGYGERAFAGPARVKY